MANKLIGLRLSDEIIQKLEVIAHNNNQTINSVMKNAIMEWLEIFFRVRTQGMIILGKPFLSNLLDFIDLKKMKQLAELTAKRKADFYQFFLGKNLDNEAIDDFIRYTPRLLGNKGLMWFDHIEVTKDKTSIHIKGIHNLGENWSKFLMFLFNYLMGTNFNLTLNEETVKSTANSLFLEYIVKKK